MMWQLTKQKNLALIMSFKEAVYTYSTNDILFENGILKK